MPRGNLTPKPKTTSLKIRPELWKKFKITCIEVERPMKECLEEAIMNLINNKAPKPSNGDKK